MLAAIHDAEVGQQENEDEQRPESLVETADERRDEARTHPQQKTIDTRSDGEQQHTEGCDVEIVGRRNRFAAQIRPYLLDSNHHCHAKENEGVGARKSIGVGGRFEGEQIAEPKTETEEPRMHHGEQERNK